MEDIYDQLADRAITGSQSRSAGTRYLIGVAGAPGSGKSLLAREVVHRINILAGGVDIATNVPMDGFHYFRRELDAMPDPALAHARRGAQWTFDAAAYVACLAAIKAHSGEALKAPSFDHGVGDPVADGVQVLPQHTIVVSEGNYLLLDDGPWAQLAEEGGIFDDTWFIECDLDVAMERVFDRQIGNGVAPEVSQGRIDGNDRPNAELVDGTKGRARIVVPSLPLRETQRHKGP